MERIGKTDIEVVFKDSSKIGSDFTGSFLSLKDLDSSLPIEQREMSVRELCRDILNQASFKKYKVIVFLPILLDNFPVLGLTRIVTQEIHRFLKRNKTAIEKIIIACEDKKLFDVFEKEVFGYLNHLLKDLAGEPYCTVDVIIELLDGIVIIERSNPPFGWALPGGFVDPDESLEIAVRREAMEETNLELKDLRQFHTYSEPNRDPRFHTIDTVFVAKGVGTPKSGDDAKNLKVVPYDKLLDGSYAFDHKKILEEYLGHDLRKR